jgi:aspartyl-tRNA(Asn)/glutamyl-tRNA(Gln) amidotransferase subunit C
MGRMAKLSITDIEKVARLARIDLKDQEKDQLTTEVGSILDFVETIQSVDTQGVEPTAQVTGLQDVLRDDLVKKCDVLPAELLQNVPGLEDGYIKVPKVL